VARRSPSLTWNSRRKQTAGPPVEGDSLLMKVAAVLIAGCSLSRWTAAGDDRLRRGG
jgi:hypothetical protein